MFKVNLHTHTIGSPDALINEDQIKEALELDILNQIAITDHDEINIAKNLASEISAEKIIIGQEVTLNNGTHLIGLFLTEFIPKGLSAVRTAQLIRSQKGIILAPHPFNPKYGIGLEALDKLRILKLLDIIEVFNGWNYRNILNIHSKKKQNKEAFKYAQKHKLAISAATDAHTFSNIGKAYTKSAAILTRENIISQLTPESYDRAKREILVENYNKIGLEQIRGGLKILKYIAKSKIPFLS